MSPDKSGWLVDLLLGGVVGGAVAAVVALNLTIFLGPDSGYETSVSELFAHSSLAGLLVVAVLAAGPVVGVVLARRRRRKIHDSRDDRSAC